MWLEIWKQNLGGMYIWVLADPPPHAIGLANVTDVFVISDIACIIIIY